MPSNRSIGGGPIKTIKRPGWHYFDAHVESCDAVRGRALDTLESDDRVVAQWFIDALAGCPRVLDVGCGSGYPGLYVAGHVGELVGIDAAPNMVRAALAHATRLEVHNARFLVENATCPGLDDGSFDGAMVCGAFESMDWQDAHQTLDQIWRVLKPGGRLAVLEQDWARVLEHKPRRQASIRYSGERLSLRVFERTQSPPAELDKRYRVDPASPSGKRLLAVLDGRRRTKTALTDSDLAPGDVVELLYEENAQFDRETMRSFAASRGFQNVTVEALEVWSPGVLVLTATKDDD